VMVDEPTGVYFGGLVAAPVFKAVVEQALRTLGVPPDLEVKAPAPVTAQAPKTTAKPLTVAANEGVPPRASH